MAFDDFAASYTRLVPQLAEGTTTPRAYLEQCLGKIAARESEVEAFVCTDIERSRKLADESTERWRAGRPLSAYDGVPIGVKDIIETEDFPTEMGSPLFAGWKSGRDAAVVKALRAAGAVIVGKTVTTEFAASHPNKTRNPWDGTRTPGGSSSGSAAAIGAGFLPVALGTQVVGSIVRPSSFCGAIGYKPSIGGINRGGSHDFLSQSCTGLIASSVDDAWIIARDLAWRAGGDPGFPGIAGPEQMPTPSLPAAVAVFETSGWAVASSEAQACFQQGLAKLKSAGVRLVDRKSSPLVEDIEEALKSCFELTRRLNAFESRWPYNHYRDMDETKLSDPSKERIVLGFDLTLDDYRRDLAAREAIRASYHRLQGQVGCSLALSATGPAPKGLAYTGDSAFAVNGSMLGVPTWGLPVFAVEGLPLGLQVMGFLNHDADLAAYAGGLYGLLGRAPLRIAGPALD
ncbi:MULTISPECIES: amidase [unclassified Beijerinckia]|uniref:amidase n=1 Tax=unclassified Beijerinckia TaxID=2638183 RepID=UPI00089547C3|nr:MULTISPECIES: amidase [unclassified Beijerinckia]MDH7795985.1 Asp-tRNA(Asn)/Glu-tRNA(Gln) amidotransferase A subunit family amidase [Beijerinckia sp. GAS462]SEC25099.1 Asp-tRNAAsn/Glu-tRNAGln amidotransferase A subunit [Beijerinckia sp. 28-YEA-48]